MAVVKPKRTAKDTVFKDLFQDKNYLLQLYQTLHPEDSTATVDDLTDITQESILTDDIYNDLGFHVKDKVIILVEAQSTWSYNILIRSMLYLAKTYQDYCNKHEINLYGSKKAELPVPELYVIYTKPRTNHPEVISLRQHFFPQVRSCIDAEARVIFYEEAKDNIINQYITFCMVLDEQVQKYGRTAEAIEETLRICQSRNVLHAYLKAHEQEVKTIMGDLFDQEKATEFYLKDMAKEIAAKAAKAAKEAKEANDRADKEAVRADKEAVRADVAEAEVKKLKEMLQKLTGKVAAL